MSTVYVYETLIFYAFYVKVSLLSLVSYVSHSITSLESNVCFRLGFEVVSYSLACFRHAMHHRPKTSISESIKIVLGFRGFTFHQIFQVNVCFQATISSIDVIIVYLLVSPDHHHPLGDTLMPAIS